MAGGKRRGAHGASVRQGDLPWKSMPLSSQAESVNVTTDDGFDTLDLDDDGFMGLQAVEGFDVVYEKDATGKNKTAKIVKAKGKGGKGGEHKKGDETKATSKKASASKKAEASTKAEPKGKRKAAEIDEDEKEEEEKDEIDEEQDEIDEEQEEEDPEDATEASSHTQSRPLSSKDRRAAHLADDGDLDINAALLAAREQSLLEDDDAGDDDQQGADAALPGWSAFPLLAPIKRALAKLGFQTPTQVQAETLPLSLGLDATPRDVVGVAETGSGKTLAYGLPILQYIAEHPSTSLDRPLEALILAPTRELALQVGHHLQAVSDAGGRFANIATICGGMAIQKQERILEQRGGAHIVVATPGRLWDVLKQNDGFARRMRQARFVVIDEADRMVEAGHFAEINAILRMVRRTTGAIPANPDMQTLVFSATMTKSLQQNLKKKQWRKKKRSAEPTNTLDDLLSRVDFRDEDVAIVDLVTEKRVASNLLEAKIECIGKEKDAYLYYLLMRYPGRTLVFLNAIDGVRRLTPILTALGLDVYPLHGQLQQQQRLRNLDRFRRDDGKSKVLLATDVAARGIDVEGVDHVVHFQLPRSADAYVHRSGRTARAGHHGIAVALVEPNEQRLLAALWRALQRADPLQALPIEYTLLEPVRERLSLAKQIDALQHRHNKASHEDAWIKKLAEEVDMDLDSEDEDPDADTAASGRKKSAAAKDARLASLKQQLAALLARPITTRGVSQRYLTSGTRPELLERLLDGDREVLGIKRSTAHADMSAAKKQRR